MRYTYRLKYLSKGGFEPNILTTFNDTDKNISDLEKRIILIVQEEGTKLSQFEFEHKSQRYRILDFETEDIMDKIIILLKKHDFVKAHTLFKEHRDAIDLNQYKEYLTYYKAIADIQKYFSKNFIEKGKAFKLDEQQAEAISKFGCNTLVASRAGSGKTRVIVALLLYLLERQGFSWNSIYILAFNKSVPEEILDRVQNQVTLRKSPNKYSKINVAQTFHKLAYEWANYKGEVLANEKKRFIKIIIEYIKDTDSDFKERVFKFFRQESTKVDKLQFKDPVDYYTFVRNSKFRTLRGESVKSLGEKWIADFLFEHGINYHYECSFYPSYIKEDNIVGSEDVKARCLAFLEQSGGVTKPDFYLRDANIILEHWGIDEKENNIKRKKEFSEKFDISCDEYKSKMEWKRKFWQPAWRKILKPTNWAIKDICSVKKLIETSICDLKVGRESFEKKLVNILESEALELKKRDHEELISDVWDRAIDRFATLIESFINRVQQNNIINQEAFIKSFDDYKEYPRVYEFLKLGLQVFKFYEEQLFAKEKIQRLIEYNQFRIDFNQLICKAVRNIEEGILDEEVKKIKSIIIDEYQDFSELFYSMICAMKKRNPSIRVFCVGDSWQSINRFAGSDTVYFEDFKKFFDDAEVKSITTNYRSGSKIVSTSNRFMISNGFDGEPARAHRGLNSSFISIEYVDKVFIENREREKDYIKDQLFMKQFDDENNRLIKSQYLKKCFEIVMANKEKEILILHRNNHFSNQMKIKAFSNKLIKVVEYECDDNFKINTKTMHRSKGLEADVVILLEVNQGVIPMFHPDNELYQIFGEGLETNLRDQKRLFYVAMTRAKEKLYILCESDKKSDFIENLI